MWKWSEDIVLQKNKTYSSQLTEENGSLIHGITSNWITALKTAREKFKFTDEIGRQVSLQILLIMEACQEQVQ